MAEAAQIDWGGHANNIEYVAREVLDFDQAIGEAMKFVDENRETLLIITADHETGGISLIGGDMSQGRILANFSTGDHTGIMVPVFAYGPGAEWFRGVYQNTAIYQKMLIDALRVRR
jgi:alkaline phosphatase